MPTPISSGDKNAIIAIVKLMDPVEANNLQTVLNNYEDIIHLIARQYVEFEYYPNYLTEVMTCFSNAAGLTGAGIYFNQGTIGPNPKVIINSTVAGTVSITTPNNGLGIYNSTINNITVGNGATVSDIWIASGSTVKILDSSAAGSFVNNIWVRNLRTPASLLSVAIGSNINQNGVHVDDGAYYGGIAVNPAATCAIPVTSLAVSEQTYNSVKLAWTKPASGYISIVVFYKKSDGPTWIPADDVGDYLPDLSGFTFRKLERDTNYDFNVVVTCINGGEANATIDGVTVCC